MIVNRPPNNTPLISIATGNENAFRVLSAEHVIRLNQLLSPISEKDFFKDGKLASGFYLEKIRRGVVAAMEAIESLLEIPVNDIDPLEEAEIPSEIKKILGITNE